MLTFLTLLLGVVWGSHRIELNAPAGTAAVEIALDGNVQARRTRPPWTFVLDLGSAPAPHHLDAAAFDASGKEIGRARQKLNMPRPETEATLALLPGAGGRGRAARLAWDSIAGAPPRRVTVTFDGTPIPAPDPRRIELPSYVPERLHFLRAIVELRGGQSAETEITIGGKDKDETSRELTAVALCLSEGRAPDAAGMRGWLAAGGAPAGVAAVEEGGDARVVVVLDEDGPRAFTSLRRSLLFGAALGSLTGGPEVRAVFAYTSAVAGTRRAFDVYPRTFPLNLDVGLLGALAELEAPEDAPFSGAVRALRCPRVADAATAAALNAATGAHPRAVVVALSGAPDASLLAPERAVAFLRDLGVPLHVWLVGSASSEAAAGWGRPRPVKTRAQFRDAVRDLEALLASQRIVWVEGVHLPQDVALGPAAPQGVSIAR